MFRFVQFVYPLFGSVRFDSWKTEQNVQYRFKRNVEEWMGKNETQRFGVKGMVPSARYNKFECIENENKKICVYDGFGSKIYDSTDWIEFILNEHLLFLILFFSGRILFSRKVLNMLSKWFVVGIDRTEWTMSTAFPSVARNKINKLHIS